jgi:mercuric ion binding protein
MKKIIVMAVLSIAATPALAAESLRATVNGMVCAFCAQGIEKRIAKMTATKAVFVDLKHKTVAVEPKDGATLDEAAIRAEIKDVGYDVVKVEKVPMSVAQIRSELKARK